MDWGSQVGEWRRNGLMHGRVDLIVIIFLWVQESLSCCKIETQKRENWKSI
jgi:hypothetical protein